jgi:hypothetical protein
MQVKVHQCISCILHMCRTHSISFPNVREWDAPIAMEKKSLHERNQKETVIVCGDS